LGGTTFRCRVILGGAIFGLREGDLSPCVWFMVFL
jgi:hypothetical protein